VTADSSAPRSLSPTFLHLARKVMMTSIWWWLHSTSNVRDCSGLLAASPTCFPVAGL
jgi:hypothetical protein